MLLSDHQNSVKSPQSPGNGISETLNLKISSDLCKAGERGGGGEAGGAKCPGPGVLRGTRKQGRRFI